MTWPLDAARGSSPKEESPSSVIWCLPEAKARRVWRKAERAVRALAGGNHSRVWRRMSDPFAGWRDRAKHAIDLDFN